MDLDRKCDISSELLFFETFAHENDQESKLDLVQFASPIIIDEIRIIPLGAQVYSDLPGGFRLGATNPSSFEVTFYINDFTKPTVCTFSDFGRFSYKENINIRFVPEERKPTDGLLIKGKYAAITLAILGVQTNVKDIIANEEIAAKTPVSDPLTPSQAPSADDHCHHSVHSGEFAFAENFTRKDSPVHEKEFEPVLERIVQNPNENELENIHLSSKSNVNDDIYYSERTKEPSVDPRDPEIGSTSVNSRDENLDPRKRFNSSPCNRHLSVHSPHSLSPVRSPQSVRSPMSPQSDISLKCETNIPDPRSPIMDHKKSISARSSYSRHRASPQPTYSNHSPRSPRYIQSRSASPWYKKQHNPSHPSSPASPLSPHHYQRKPHSPTKIRSPVKTPPRESSTISSPFNKKHRRARTPSHSPSPSPSIPFKRLEIENDSSNHSIPILPVNTDLLEEISPEHSLSDWAESISDDENLDDIESGDGEPDESVLNSKINNTITDNNDNNLNSKTIDTNVIRNDNHFIQSPNHHQPSESQEPEPFESISSEEEYFEEGNMEESDRLSHYSDYDLCDYAFSTPFDPYNCEFNPIRALRDPSKTNYQRLRSSNYVNFNEDKRTLLLSNLNDVRTRSSTWVESVETLAKDIEHVSLDKPEVLDTVLSWLRDGLDFDLAIKQTMIPYKVRHLKAGIKLCISLANTDEPIIKKLIEFKIPLSLMNLYYKLHMSLPLKLLILQAFDAFCDSVAGTEHILNEKYVFNFDESTEVENPGESTTCYQHLLLLLTSKPSSRIAIALESLFSKLHFYHLLLSFKQLVDQPHLDVLSISTHLRKIGSTFTSARKLLTQKTRCLPVTCFFELKEAKCDCFLSIYNWFEHHQFLNNLVLLLKSSRCELLASEVYQLLDCMTKEESFPRFLLSSTCCSKTNELISLITHTNNDVYNQTELSGDQLSYLLQSYSLTDSLICKVKSDSFDLTKCDEDVELCTIFRNFHNLISSPIGRECVIRALSSSNNFQLALLPFLSVSGEAVDQASPRLYKSIFFEYPVKLCLSMVQFGEDNILHILKTYGSNLLTLSKNNRLPKLSSLSDWIKPVDCMLNFSYSESTFKELTAIVKRHADEAARLKENEIFKLQPQMITVVRILSKLCIQTQKMAHTHFLDKEPVNELKYYYATIQVFSHDGLSSILTLLQKLSQTYLRPSHQSFALVGDQGSTVMGFVRPSVKLVKEMLRVLIQARSKDFRDTSPIPVILKVYSLMCMYTRTSFAYLSSRETVRDIVDILMFYTQICLTSSESDSESLGKGVWTKMISEVLQYTFSAPMTFVHGLSLLSELLPLPLPFQTLSPLTEEEVNKMINMRKLWSAHLLGLSGELETLISTFVVSSSPIIQQLLRRVCIQISDLSSPASTMMVRSVLEVVLDFLPSDKNPKLSSSLLYVLNLLSYLSTHPPFKMAFIHTMHIGGKLDEKYFSIVNKLLRLLREEPSKPIEFQINHLILAFLQSLCDSDIYLNSRISPIPSLQILSNSLPPRESLKLIISVLLRFLKNSLKSSLFSQSTSTTLKIKPSSSSSTATAKTKPSANRALSSSTNLNSILPVLRILSLLCSHEFGFSPLKQSIFEEAPMTISIIFNKISDSIRLEDFKSNDNDLNLIICGLLDFLKAFILENEDRSGKLSYKEVTLLISWEPKLSDCLTDKKISSQQQSSSLIMVNDEHLKHRTKRLKTDDKETEAHELMKSDELSTTKKLNDEETDKQFNNDNEAGISSSKEVEMNKYLHPLSILNDYLLSIDTIAENDIHCMRNTVKRLLNLLSTPNDGEPSGDALVNVELPVIEPLPLQFSKREVFIVTSNIDQEKLNANFWLSVPTYDDDHNQHSQLQNHITSTAEVHLNSIHDDIKSKENDIDGEKRINLIELCQKYLPGDFNLKKMLENLCQAHEEEVDVANSSKKPLSNSVNQSIKRFNSLIPSRETKSFTNVKKSFVAPMRNRGFGRQGSMLHSSRANDPFRSRPPNTSRPPSMHVDDFVALEQSGTNCNTYEAPSKRMKLDYTLKIRNSTSTGGNGNSSTNTGGGNSSSMHNSSSRSFGGSGSIGSRSSPSYHNIDPYSNRRTLISSSHSHSHQSPLRNAVPSVSGRGTMTRYSRESYSPPARSDSTGPSSSSQHWTKSNITNRRDSRESRDSRSARSNNR